MRLRWADSDDDFSEYLLGELAIIMAYLHGIENDVFSTKNC